MPAYHAAKLQNTALSCCFDTSSLVYLIAWLWVVGPVQSWLARWERSYDLCTNESSCLLLYLANSTISRFPAVLRNVIIIRGLRVAGMGIYVLGAGNGMSSTAAVRECVHGSESVVCMAELRAAAAAAAAHHNAAAARVCMHGWCFDRGKLLCIARNVYSRCGWYRRSPPPRSLTDNLFFAVYRMPLLSSPKLFSFVLQIRGIYRGSFTTRLSETRADLRRLMSSRCALISYAARFVVIKAEPNAS